METHVVLLLLLPLGLLAAFFTWTYGYVQTARALAVLAGIALVITGLGAGILLWFYYVEVPLEAEQVHGLNLLAGLFNLLVLILGGGIEAFGAAWTLAICLIGLRRKAGGRFWFVVLLVGGFAPLVGSALALLFPFTLTAFFRQMVSSDTSTILGVSPLAAGSVCVTMAPLVAAVVTTADAVHTAVRGRRTPVEVAVG